MEDFQSIVLEYYRKHGRHDLPWRLPGKNGFDPYKIMVSELMLQQTQVQRVIPKYEAFMQEFPDVDSLADAPQKDVLVAWSGLGYNRRALYLQRAALAIKQDFGGNFPDDTKLLTTLPGVGKNTAGAIAAYAFNEPAAYIETNIRTVYLHHFFADQTAVSDKQIFEKVAETLDTENPRQWYWALMDYGSYLKQSIGNNTQRSKAYSRQSAFAGSRREIRGQIIRSLAGGPKTSVQLISEINDDRLSSVLNDLVAEKMIVKSPSGYHL